MAGLTADALLYELGMDEPEEIDVELVAAEFNAFVVYEEQLGCAACLVGYGDRAIISVEKNTSPERQRFSIGHELAHWLFDREKQVFHCKVKCQQFTLDLRRPSECRFEEVPSGRPWNVLAWAEAASQR
jgi:Zn-dependent peptidase ImmA (M78 family)